MYANSLLNKEVVGLNGWKIGKSKEIIFDKDNWRITHLDIELKGNIEEELGLANLPLAHTHFPLTVSNIQGIGDVITLTTTKEELTREIRAYKNQTTPTIVSS